MDISSRSTEITLGSETDRSWDWFSFSRRCQSPKVIVLLYTPTWVPVVPHPCQHLALPALSILVIMLGVHEYLSGLICISLITNTIQHLICLLATCISSFVKRPFKSSAYFKNWIVCFKNVFWSSLYILDMSPFPVTWIINTCFLSVSLIFTMILIWMPMIGIIILILWIRKLRLRDAQ